MKRFYIFKDGYMEASTSTKELAIDLIRQYQAQETHLFLKANFTYIEGEEEVYVPYESPKNPPRSNRRKER